MATATGRRPLEEGAVDIPSLRVNPLRAARFGGCVLRHVGRDLALDRGRAPRAAAARGIGQAFTDLGPTFIKLGQMISANPAIFPPFMIEAFEHNQDRCRPLPFATVRDTVEAELGLPLDGAFSRFEPVPLASGSIAQVHYAELPNGERVAVKVRRPGLVELLGQDLALMQGAARMAVRLRPQYNVANPLGAVADFKITLGEELAFRLEAQRMKTLAAVFAGWPIAIPEVIDDHTTDRVLTMTFLGGTKINDLATIDAKGHDRKALADLLISSLLHSSLQRGIFHGDGHPGNLVVLDDGRLGVYDFGIVGQLADEDRIQVSRFFRGLILQDFNVMAEALMTLADLSEADLEGATADMEVMTSALLGPDGTFRLTDIDHAGILTAFLGIANTHHLIIPTDLILLFKQLLYLNGLANVLDPDLDVFEGDRFFQHFARDDGMASGTHDGAPDRSPG